MNCLETGTTRPKCGYKSTVYETTSYHYAYCILSPVLMFQFKIKFRLKFFIIDSQLSLSPSPNSWIIRAGRQRTLRINLGLKYSPEYDFDLLHWYSKITQWPYMTQMPSHLMYMLWFNYFILALNSKSTNHKPLDLLNSIK